MAQRILSCGHLVEIGRIGVAVGDGRGSAGQVGDGERITPCIVRKRGLATQRIRCRGDPFLLTTDVGRCLRERRAVRTRQG